MKVRILKDQKLSHDQSWNLATQAAREACTQLEKEGLYTDQNDEILWRTAWSAADYSIVCEDAELEEATWLATQAARRRARIMQDGDLRRELIMAGKITPAWLRRLAQ